MTAFTPSCKQEAATWAKLKRLLKTAERAHMKMDDSMHESNMAKSLEHLRDTLSSQDLSDRSRGARRD